MKAIAIVEGEGEVAALPLLLRRITSWQAPHSFVEIPIPIRVRRDRFLNRDDEFRRFLLLASAKCSDDGWILILLDADDDCPADLAPRILERAKAIVGHRRVSVVLANREYEAWFIAAAQSLDGQRGFSFDPEENVECEVRRDAKGWIRQRMANGTYGETTDQAAFSAHMDLTQVFERSRSFRKLCAEWEKQIAASAKPA